MNEDITQLIFLVISKCNLSCIESYNSIVKTVFESKVLAIFTRWNLISTNLLLNVEELQLSTHINFLPLLSA